MDQTAIYRAGPGTIGLVCQGELRTWPDSVCLICLKSLFPLPVALPAPLKSHLLPGPQPESCPRPQMVSFPYPTMLTAVHRGAVGSRWPLSFLRYVQVLTRNAGEASPRVCSGRDKSGSAAFTQGRPGAPGTCLCSSPVSLLMPKVWSRDWPGQHGRGLLHRSSRLLRASLEETVCCGGRPGGPQGMTELLADLSWVRGCLRVVSVQEAGSQGGWLSGECHWLSHSINGL